MSSEAKTSSAGKQGRDLTTGSIPRHLVAFALPMLAGSVLQTAYSIINAIWVGRGIGKVALAAVAVGFPVIFVLIAAAFGFTMAANVLSAQAYGAKDHPYLRRVVSNSVILTMSTSFVCLAFGYFFSGAILARIHTPPSVLPMATAYMRILIWTIPPMFGMFLMSSLLRGIGDSATPLYFQVGSVLLNAVLDPILIFGWLGAPKMGLNGTAVASIICTVGALSSLLFYLHLKKSLVRPNWLHLRPDWATASLLTRVGVPSMFQQTFVSIGLIVITRLVNGFGENGAAAFGAAMRIDNIAFMPAMTIGMAVSALAGQNIGAKEYSRVQEVFKWGIIVGCGITAVFSIVMLAIPGVLMRIFTTDPEVIRIGIPYLRIVGGSYVILAAMFVSNGVINGAGHTLITTVISFVALWAVRVPLAMYLSRHYHSIQGIWWSMALGFAGGTAVSLAYYFSGRWKRPLRGSHIGEESVTPIPDIVIE